MNDDPAKIPSPFDVRTIEKLIALMSQHELNEVDLREGDLRIRLRRGPSGVQVMPMVAPPAAVPNPAPNAAPAPAAAEPAKPSRHLVEIKSPTPGTFYAAPEPGKAPFVHVGARVTPQSVVCIIEAMKIMNPIEAECTGVIAEILVQNETPVEWGTVLFRVDPTA